MARKVRPILAKVSYHAFSRCINGMDLMANDYIKELLLEVIAETQELYEFELQFIEILDNHVHMVIKTLNDKHTISKIMQRIKSVFARRYNKLHGRKGPFWNERFGSKIVEHVEDAVKYALYLLWYCAYNIVRKKKVDDPRDYKYGTINAYLTENFKFPVKITLSSFFIDLGRSFEERVAKFLEVEAENKELLCSKL